jgi:hypothetical protein
MLDPITERLKRLDLSDVTRTSARHGQEAAVVWNVLQALTGVDQPANLVIRIGYGLPLAWGLAARHAPTALTRIKTSCA